MYPLCRRGSKMRVRSTRRQKSAGVLSRQEGQAASERHCNKEGERTVAAGRTPHAGYCAQGRYLVAPWCRPAEYTLCLAVATPGFPRTTEQVEALETSNLHGATTRESTHVQNNTKPKQPLVSYHVSPFPPTRRGSSTRKGLLRWHRAGVAHRELPRSVRSPCVLACSAARCFPFGRP